MKHEDRRRELGRMLLDVAKYLATVGLIGSFLTHTLSLEMGAIIALVVLGLAVIAFYTIPPKRGEKQ